MRKFSDINQFRHVVAAVNHRATYIGQNENDEPMYDEEKPKPTLTFTGTVKLHGSNCGVSFSYPDCKIETQSRERVLTQEDDNFGFCKFVETSGADGFRRLKQVAETVAQQLGGMFERGAAQNVQSVTVFGEWCGPTVNAQTGIGRLPNRWVVFSAVLTLSDDSDVWLPVDLLAQAWKDSDVDAAVTNIFFISDFPQYSISIDFNCPEASLDILEDMTLAVEAECPVAKMMGGEGIGEGLVWSLRDQKYGHLVFKTKGLKHKGTKNRRLVEISPEVMAGQAAFVAAVVTESRLQQGFDVIRSRHGKVYADHVGEFLEWFGHDVLKEESDTLAASGLERKQVMKPINLAAREWLMPRLDQL